MGFVFLLSNRVERVLLTSVIERTSSINRTHRKIPAWLCAITESIEQQSCRLGSIEFNWFLWLRYWQTRTHCCGNIVAHGVSLRAQTGKHLLRIQNVSEQNQKHLCPGHKICIRNKCCARGQTRNICVGNNVSAPMCPRLPLPLGLCDWLRRIYTKNPLRSGQ